MVKKRRDSEANASAATTCCRLCRRTDPSEFWDLFENNLAQKIMNLVNVKIQENDKLPKVVCTNCRNSVQNFLRFKCQVEKSDQEFREVVPQKSSNVSMPIVLVKNLDMVEATVAYLKKNNANFCKSIPDKNKANSFTQNGILNSNSDPGRNACEESGTKSNYFLRKNFAESIDFSTRENSRDNNCEKPVMLRTKRHKCNYCIKSFANLSLLEKHTVVHKKNPETVYACFLCCEKFSSIEKVKTHAMEAHALEVNEEKVEENGLTSDSEDNLENSKSKKNTKYSCKFCGKTFIYYKSFLAHLENHPDNYSKFFREIKKKPKIVQTAARVLNLNEPTNPNSNLKPDSSTANVKYNNENNNETIDSSNVNIINSSELSNNSSLNADIPNIVENNKQLDCKKLDDDFENESFTKIVNIKKKINKQLRPYKCNLCQKAFAQRQSLENHLERHRRASEYPKRYLCEICSKIFTLSGSLRLHMRTHTGVKPHVCKVCNKAFTKRTYLRLHLRIHSGEKPYSCKYCSKTFARANTLARHLTVHTGEAKYQCKICSKSFRRLNSLNEHMYLHTGQRPYACKFCSKSFNNAGSMYAHTKKCKKKHPINLYMPTPSPEPLQPIENTQCTEMSPENDLFNSSSQILIFSDDGMDGMISNDMIPIEPSYQYIISDAQKSSPIDVLEPFTTDESDIFNLNSKQFRTTPDYELFQSF